MNLRVALPTRHYASQVPNPFHAPFPRQIEILQGQTRELFTHQQPPNQMPFRPFKDLCRCPLCPSKIHPLRSFQIAQETADGTILQATLCLLVKGLPNHADIESSTPFPITHEQPNKVKKEHQTVHVNRHLHNNWSTVSSSVTQWTNYLNFFRKDTPPPKIMFNKDPLFQRCPHKDLNSRGNLIVPSKAANRW